MVDGSILTKENLKFENLWQEIVAEISMESPAYPKLDVNGELAKELAAGAEAGDAECLQLLGDAYRMGGLGDKICVEQNFPLARYLLMRAACKRNGQAGFSLGMMYGKGEGTNRNDLKEWACYYNSALNNHSRGQMMTAVCYSRNDSTEYGKALAHYWMKKAAENGYAEAQYRTAKDYLSGKGCESDAGLGHFWMKKAAQQGQPDALVFMGIMYATGSGEEQNPDRAEKLLRQAAEVWHPEGMYELAKLLMASDSPDKQDEGWQYMDAAVQAEFPGALNWMALRQIEEPEHRDEAMEMLEKAANAGYIPAMANVADLYCYGDHGVTIDYNKALYWNTRAAQLGNDLAQSNLALMYVDGIGVEKDLNQAFYWASEAANSGKPHTLVNLAIMYKNGEGTPVNMGAAFRLYMEAAKQGNSDAQYFVGKFYKEGTGTTQNSFEAFMWFSAAADQGDPDAMYQIGKLYLDDNDFIDNQEEAIQWLRKAAESGSENAAELLNRL